ncbi:cysteine proteinase [Neolentinus lepideus HHB14362 ss-1]|uniref:Cysteine proteinase n=1 Tax=Neolentinus lepideus HHB14362 ss-1 TaxID=1314782 RepID=A0A165SDQ6_9AGAM|nr:cysteine proteinase [Neolentinus lepideus HHB14362 ss-1]
MGLYAANTLGDGNCLFRALSDQLYGTEAYHHQLRDSVCNWVAAHKDRYAPFCEDERGLDTHLRCMRQPATYGGHMELSAFAHMTRRDVKVVQPGLVYVIEWAAGGDPAPTPFEQGPSSEPETSLDESTLDARERRRLAREKRREAKDRKQKEKEKEKAEEDEDPRAAVYVAYYDWEHFSSIRNQRGPHTGLPRVREAPPPDDSDESASLPPAPSKKRPPAKIKSLPTRTRKLTPAPPTPSQIPLPPSRSPSPLPSSVPSPLPSSAPSPLPSSQASDAPPSLRASRSPKRAFDDSASSSSQSSEKRARTDDEDTPASGFSEDTPALSASGFSTESSASSPAPTPPPDAPPKSVLTRRERKRLGLPKSRVGGPGMRTRSAGKIVIPGGRFRKDEGGGEWRKNGAGRVDVRGFRELKI